MTVAAALGVACGGTIDVSHYATPEAMQEAGMQAYRRGDCKEATAVFQRLQFEVPTRDPRIAQARYYLAECMLREGDHLEAARQFRRVADEFPQHPLAPDALLRAGDAYAELWAEPALDPSYGETARVAYGELLSRFPSSPAAQRAQLRIADLNDRFAEKEYRNGRYYQRFRAYDSAVIYFRDVVARYPQSRFAPLAVLRLIEVYDRIGYAEEKREMCGHLQRYYADFASQAEGCG